MATCLHCDDPVLEASSGGPSFCCRGCEAAHNLVVGQGLESYYRRRSLDSKMRSLKPDESDLNVDFSRHLHRGEDGICRLHLMVEGLHCAACVWLIESLLTRAETVVSARVNMTTHRLALAWTGEPRQAETLLAPVLQVGYRLVPYDPELIKDAAKGREKELLRAMAVAGFAAANVMLFSVSVWAGQDQDMTETTRQLMHWLSALVALPAITWCGRPFFRSAVQALRGGRTNMDVPISLAVILTAAMSLAETVWGGPHVYFDSAIMLLFFLLIGRYLDSRARGRARTSAARLLNLGATAVTVLDDDGQQRFVPPTEVKLGMMVLVAAGERLGVDGEITSGRSDVDTSLISGESLPEPVGPGRRVFAGTLNLSGPLRIRIVALGEDTLLAEIVRLMEDAEQGRARYVALADRVARWYAPIVHGLGAAAFLGWWLLAGLAWQESLLIAVSVLIVTCPCALALAVPVVQVIASGRLMSQGILLKSATALERLTDVDTVVFDKTGTLTEGRLRLQGLNGLDPEDLRLAASLAGVSTHPLARALCRAAPRVPPAQDVREIAGQGLQWGEVRLGSRLWCGVADDPVAASDPELWLSRPGKAAVRFSFADSPRRDAAQMVTDLKERGCEVILLSGDRVPAVAHLAARLGIEHFEGGCSPAQKTAYLARLKQDGKRVLMVGDGLNDAPALAAAQVSASPSSAADISQTVADVVFQGDLLHPVIECLEVARRADDLVKQNFGLAFSYNAVTIPMAAAGLVTPLIAAIAMSSSSLVVIANALRLGRRAKE